MPLNETTRTRIETLLKQNPVVLFMKGNPQQPQCGFSAAASGMLNELLPDYATVDVLQDAEIREGIKQYGNWPTIPQLYVKGELVGGSDIVQSMYNSGQLQELFGLPKPDRTPPSITITDKAAAAIRSALADAEAGLALHLSIDARFQPQFHLAEPGDDEIRSESNGIDILMDIASAQRARGIRIDWVETMQGAGLVDRQSERAGRGAGTVRAGTASAPRRRRGHHGGRCASGRRARACRADTAVPHARQRRRVACRPAQGRAARVPLSHRQPQRTRCGAVSRAWVIKKYTTSPAASARGRARLILRFRNSATALSAFSENFRSSFRRKPESSVFFLCSATRAKAFTRLRRASYFCHRAKVTKRLGARRGVLIRIVRIRESPCRFSAAAGFA